MKKGLLIFLGLLLLLIGAAALYFLSDSSNPYDKNAEVKWGRFSGKATEKLAKNHGEDIPGCNLSVPKAEIPTFTEIPFPSKNVFDNTKSLPLMASALVDINNDGVDEIFVGGGITQADKLYQYSANGFTDITQSSGLPAKPDNSTTIGAVSFDLDKDGNTDILIASSAGVYWYQNTGEGFKVINLNAPINDKSTPAALTLGDYDRDGDADIFLATYIRLEKMEGQTIFTDKNYGSSSLLLQNQGDNTFQDVTEATGLSYVHNTFMGVFVDMNNDGWLDIVVAYDTGEARTYKNNTDGTYSLAPNPLTGKFAYPMGIAIGDYNNDGLVDFFFTNTGTSVPVFLARGDLADDQEFVPEWLLFRNDGDFKFTDVAKETKVADFEFSWGAIFQDFNLDGRQDLVVAENYVDFPPHKLFKLPCRFLVQRADGTFDAIEQQAGTINKNYAITPLTSDFNQDGYPDLVWTNLNGPMRALINNGDNNNHYIGFRFPETSDYAGASVTVETIGGRKITDFYVVGEGLASDQTSVVTLGIGLEDAVKTASISYPDGTQQVIPAPSIDKVHLVQRN